MPRRKGNATGWYKVKGKHVEGSPKARKPRGKGLESKGSVCAEGGMDGIAWESVRQRIAKAPYSALPARIVLDDFRLGSLNDVTRVHWKAYMAFCKAHRRACMNALVTALASRSVRINGARPVKIWFHQFAAGAVAYDGDNIFTKILLDVMGTGKNARANKLGIVVDDCPQYIIDSHRRCTKSHRDVLVIDLTDAEDERWPEGWTWNPDPFNQ